MSQGEASAVGAGRITIGDLAALNDEITALVRAGVPLDRGLLRAGGELSGGLGRITTALGARMGRGESLEQALEGEKASIPPLYRAVVEAGSRSGRLPVALEGLTKYVRGYSEARSTIGVALWYPILVLSLAYALFLGLVTEIIPRFIGAFESLGLAVPRPVRWMERLGELAPYWWPVWPIILVLLLLAWWRSGIAARFQSTAWSIVGLFPWMRSLLADYETAGFAELLALLLEHQVPYPRAVLLAAEATGNPSMTRGARQLATAVEGGESPAQALKAVEPGAFRPMLRWILAGGAHQAAVLDGLHHLAPMYRKRAAYRAEKLQIFLPALLMILIGASATLIYGLTLFVPLADMLRELSMP